MGFVLSPSTLCIREKRCRQEVVVCRGGIGWGSKVGQVVWRRRLPLTRLGAGKLLVGFVVRSLLSRRRDREEIVARDGDRDGGGGGKGWQSRDGATLLLVLVNLIFYVLDHQLHWKEMPGLYLRTSSFRWWQLATSLFCHGDWQHLSGNLFLLLFFGRLIEEEEGGLALIFIYLFCGVVSNAVCLFLATKQAVFVGASGAVYGLFAVSVLVRFRWSWKRLVEFAVIGNFVAAKNAQEMTALGAAAARKFVGAKSLTRVNHLGHLSGAAAGVVLVILLKSIFRRRRR